jgi:hypothetical protein
MVHRWQKPRQDKLATALVGISARTVVMPAHVGAYRSDRVRSDYADAPLGPFHGTLVVDSYQRLGGFRNGASYISQTSCCYG